MRRAEHTAQHTSTQTNPRQRQKQPGSPPLPEPLEPERMDRPCWPLRWRSGAHMRPCGRLRAPTHETSQWLFPLHDRIRPIVLQPLARCSTLQLHPDPEQVVAAFLANSLCNYPLTFRRFARPISTNPAISSTIAVTSLPSLALVVCQVVVHSDTGSSGLPQRCVPIFPAACK